MSGWDGWRKWGAVLAGLGLIAALDVATSRDGEALAGYAPADAVSADPPAGTPVVGLVASDCAQLAEPAPRDAALSEAQVEDMVRRAVALAGGLSGRIAPDARRVALKVNIVEPRPRGSGVITDVRVVRALIEIVHEVAPQARIAIVEGPGDWVLPDSPPAELGPHVERVDGLAAAGYRELLDDPDLAGAGLEYVDLNFDTVTEVEVPGGGSAQDRWKLPVTVLESDFVISVPVLKIHSAIGMTNAMKNFIGIAPGMVYGWWKALGYPPHSGNPGIPHADEILAETITDLTTLSGVDFAVVDAITCMERAKSDGYGGRPVRVNAVLAGADVVAVDAISAQVIGLNPFDLEYLTLATRRGLGQCDPARIAVAGDDLAAVYTRLEKYRADEGRGHYGQGCRTWLLKGPFPHRRDAPDAEFIDVRHPGALPGQNGWSAGVYFGDDKIDLDRYFDDPANCAVYAYTELTVPRDQTAELWVGSDDGMSLWLNGERVYAHRGRRRHRLPNERLTVPLRAGTSALLVRADQARGRFDFSVNICEPEEDERYDGSRVAGLRFHPPAAAPSGPASSPSDQL